MLWLYLANHVHAFMLIKNHELFNQKSLERYEKVFNRILKAKKKNYGEFLELYNCQFWDLTCLGVMGVLLEDDEAVDIAINGHYGFKQMLNKFYDGLFWPEATVYGFGYISSCALMLAEACLKNGYENLYEYTAPSGASIKGSTDKMMLYLAWNNFMWPLITLQDIKNRILLPPSFVSIVEDCFVKEITIMNSIAKNFCSLE